MRANGGTITADVINKFQQYAGAHATGQQVSAVGPSLTTKPQTPSKNSSIFSDVPPVEVQLPNTREVEEIRSEPGAVVTGFNRSDTQDDLLNSIETEVNDAAAKYDQVERIATTVTSRNDAAKSLWTTVIGSVTQTFWALFGLLAGVPREVWLVVALIAAALMLMYLYRQIALGKIRERGQVSGSKFQVSG